jgi:polyphosphate kinase
MAGVPASRTIARTARLIDRELSFFDYIARVLGLACDSSVPLLERVRFCSICSQMLDEFFAVRLGGLIHQSSGVASSMRNGNASLHALSQVRTRALDLQAAQAELWSNELCPSLAAAGIVVADIPTLTATESAELERRYERDVHPMLTPLAVGPNQPFPHISGLSISLAAFVRDPDSGEERLARVKVPNELPRFIALGEAGRYVPLERLLEHFLPTLFPGMEIVERALFRVTRDLDSEVSNDADDLLEAVEHELRRRRFGSATRLEVSSGISSVMRERIRRGLGISDELIYPVSGLLDLSDLSELTSLDRPDLEADPWIPIARPPLGNASGADQFAAIAAAPVLVHHPYDSFASTYESFMANAADDPDVVALKATVYRAGEDTPLAPTLIRAAENGKQVVCLVEIKARGDEQLNINWAREVEQSGVHVVYGVPAMKIHAKTTLVVRRESGALRRYVHIGTGNYNHLTAKLYEDFGLFTADEEIAAEVSDLFNYLSGFAQPPDFRKLLVAPFNLHDRLIDEIRAVAEAAECGQIARMRIKINALTDEEIIAELYAASQAGARIELVVRGICSLRPGVPGLSEGIRVRSVLGRFLEHSRLFEFEAGKRRAFYVGSADLMPRNLHHRVEVVAPVEDRAAQGEIGSALDLLLSKTAFSWELDADGHWRRVRSIPAEKQESAQAAFMRRARRRASPLASS